MTNKTVTECEKALETARRVLEEARTQKVAAAEELIYEDRVAVCLSALERARNAPASG